MKSPLAHQTAFLPAGTFLLMATVGLWGCKPAAEKTPAAGPAEVSDPGGMRLAGPAFAHNEPIPRKYTVDGDDVSPLLTWSNVPSAAKELALICDDPDAPDPENPRKDPWVHWVIYKIPVTAAGLPEAIPQELRPGEPAGAVQGQNSWDPPVNIGYRGPSPPIGRHRYFFKLYALSEELTVEPGLDKRALLSAMEGKILAQAQLVGTYILAR